MSSKPKYYACEICGHSHPWEWNFDCRDDANRFTDEELDAKHGPDGYELATMTERVLADGQPPQDIAADFGKYIGHDMYGWYLADESEREADETGSSVGFDGRAHYATEEDAARALGER